jgi:hypothetical protein
VRRAVVRRLLFAVVSLVAATSVTAQQSPPRLLVMDLSYARVWEGTVRAFGEQILARAAAGVIETTRAERAPLPDEAGVERVAERVTVRVEPMAARVTRITVTVQAEGLREGSWRAIDASPATVRAVLDRIRASIG